MDEWTGMRLVDRVGGWGGGERNGQRGEQAAWNLEVLRRGDKRFLGGRVVRSDQVLSCSNKHKRLRNLLAAILYWGSGRGGLDKTGICHAIVILMKPLSFVKAAANGRCYVSD